MSKFPEAIKLISDTLWQIENINDFEKILEDLLTPQELESIAERINIIKLLKQWFTQREIAEKLWISVTTVNRWSRILKYWTWSAKELI